MTNKKDGNQRSTENRLAYAYDDGVQDEFKEQRHAEINDPGIVEQARKFTTQGNREKNESRRT